MTNEMQDALRTLDIYYSISEGNFGNGCEHGFKPAISCPNIHCEHKEAALAFETIREYQRKPSEGVWQDIGTAPRDGTRILIAAWQDEKEILWQTVCYGHWYKLQNKFVYDGYSFGHPKGRMTHWMHLPQPPQVLQGEGHE